MCVCRVSLQSLKIVTSPFHLAPVVTLVLTRPVCLMLLWPTVSTPGRTRLSTVIGRCVPCTCRPSPSKRRHSLFLAAPQSRRPRTPPFPACTPDHPRKPSVRNGCTRPSQLDQVPSSFSSTLIPLIMSSLQVCQASSSMASAFNTVWKPSLGPARVTSHLSHLSTLRAMPQPGLTCFRTQG